MKMKPYDPEAVNMTAELPVTAEPAIETPKSPHTAGVRSARVVHVIGIDNIMIHVKRIPPAGQRWGGYRIG